MRAWILIPEGPITEDIGYVLGHLTTVFERLAISRFDRRDDRSPPPPEDVDLIIQFYHCEKRSLLNHLDTIARDLGIALSNPADATWRSIDKRSYPEDYRDLVPRTLIARSQAELHAAWHALGGDVVVKNPFGFGGRGIERLQREADLDVANRVLAASPSGDVVVQEYCTGFAKGDKRIMVQKTPGGEREIIGQFRRVPPTGGWKSNLRFGGYMERCHLTDEEIRFAGRVAEIAGLDYVGLDIGEHDGRHLLIETNQAPGGLIDYDLDRGARSIEKLGRFLTHLAGHGRHQDVGLSHRGSATAEAGRSGRGNDTLSAG